MKKNLDLKSFEFPPVDGVNMAFPTFNTIDALLEEAKLRGFYYGHTPYNDMFSKLFFSGGKVIFRNDIPEEFKKSAWSYCRAFMGSFSPKHEHKEAICALIMSEILEPELAKTT